MVERAKNLSSNIVVFEVVVVGVISVVVAVAIVVMDTREFVGYWAWRC